MYLLPTSLFAGLAFTVTAAGFIVIDKSSRLLLNLSGNFLDRESPAGNLVKSLKIMEFLATPAKIEVLLFCLL
jgi:hypothetical protein